MLYDNVDEIICAHSRRDYDIMMYVSSRFLWWRAFSSRLYDDVYL